VTAPVSLDDLQYEFGALVAQGLLYLRHGRDIAHSPWSAAADGLFEATLNPCARSTTSSAIIA
jgi:hypothetical protein